MSKTQTGYKIKLEYWVPINMDDAKNVNHVSAFVAAVSAPPGGDAPDGTELISHSSKFVRRAVQS